MKFEMKSPAGKEKKTHFKYDNYLERLGQLRRNRNKKKQEVKIATEQFSLSSEDHLDDADEIGCDSIEMKIECQR